MTRDHTENGILGISRPSNKIRPQRLISIKYCTWGVKDDRDSLIRGHPHKWHLCIPIVDGHWEVPQVPLHLPQARFVSKWVALEHPNIGVDLMPLDCPRLSVRQEWNPSNVEWNCLGEKPIPVWDSRLVGTSKCWTTDPPLRGCCHSVPHWPAGHGIKDNVQRKKNERLPFRKSWDYRTHSWRQFQRFFLSGQWKCSSDDRDSLICGHPHKWHLCIPIVDGHWEYFIINRTPLRFK
jgi:hypothetical protein